MSANERDDERAEIARRLDEVTEPLTLPPGVEITLIKPGAASWSNPTSSALDDLREATRPHPAHPGPFVVGPSQAANMARADAFLRGGDHGRTDPIADLRAAVEKLPRHQTFRFGSPIPPHLHDLDAAPKENPDDQ